MSSYYISSLPSMLQYPHSHFYIFKRKLNKNGRQTPFPSLSISASSSSSNDNQTSTSSKSPKLVTFLGKGGAGKTTSAVFAAQHYAMSGLRTCLVVQSQDPLPEYLLNCKIGTSPIKCSDNLSAVRLETTKMILEPLDQLKKADARLNMTQGVLEAVVGEELGVLPAMDSIFAVLFLGRLMGMLRKDTSRNTRKDDFDIIVYDGISTHETLRMIGAASKAKLYLKYLKNLAEKTDIGRLVSPSLLRLAEEGINFSDSKSNLNGNTSAEIWERLEKILERGSSSFSDPHKFGCFLVMDLNSPASVNYALRHWGCTIQAGAQVSGAIGISSPSLNEASVEEVKGSFLPLPFAFIPHLATSSPVDWSSIMQNSVGQGSKALFSSPTGHTGGMSSPVTFDVANKSVTLFMPGFDKSEIKLYQFRGGSELLVEAGDQRRVIYLPLKIQGKVGGAKFVDRSLIITTR